MTNPRDLLRLPKGFHSSDPVDENPFSEVDVRHGLWAKATLEAEEESYRLNASFMQSRPAAGAEAIPWDMALLVMRYEIWARRSVRVVLSQEMLADWDQWLANYANAILETFTRFSPPDVALQKLREGLLGCREYWRAEGRRCAAFHKSHQADFAASQPDAVVSQALDRGGSSQSAANTGTGGNAAISEQAAAPPNASTWEEIEISFISDERVQMKVGKQLQTGNYAEMGFADRRSEKPNQGWGMLRTLAAAGGVIPDSARNSKDFMAMGKRIERVRGALRAHFQIDSDPIPLDPAGGYRCRFKLGCARSFDK